ncbi:PH domain-like protein [Myriangium duriaei CBS 260.36]|uniref:PH domain-like protein n=1 Tax=Myriangium duriaei CBS 260.36 TaxID=1168546 RepID=A0A9P4MK90_9PEZI|nr:PH domain-like protein [Myriangium duriaei CBS 260.36]
MPPKRHRRPPRQQQLQEQSDYDSETLHTDHNTSAPPAADHAVHPPPVRTNEELNLTVLKRHNPQVQQVLSVAPFAVVYTFSPTSQTWEKTGMEGTLFVCQLIPAVIYHGDESLVVERYSVMVLNRKGLDNFTTELHTSADMEITEEYVILQVDQTGQSEDPTIYGLWIFSEPGTSTEHTRVVNAKVMMECAIRSEQSREAANAAALDEDGYEEHHEEQYYDEQEQNNGYAQHEHQPQHQHQHQHQQQHQSHDYGNYGHEQAIYQQPARGQENQHASQQINLLNLFGKTAPQAQPSPHNGFTQPFNDSFQHQHYQHHQSPQPGYLPHAHPQQMPQQMPQPTQAQNLLSLFKR